MLLFAMAFFFPAGNMSMILCSNIRPFPGILTCGYRSTIIHIKKLEVFSGTEFEFVYMEVLTEEDV